MDLPMDRLLRGQAASNRSWECDCPKTAWGRARMKLVFRTLLLHWLGFTCPWTLSAGPPLLWWEWKALFHLCCYNSHHRLTDEALTRYCLGPSSIYFWLIPHTSFPVFSRIGTTLTLLILVRGKIFERLLSDLGDSVLFSKVTWDLRRLSLVGFTPSHF